MTTAAETAIVARLESLEAWRTSNRLTLASGSSEQNLAKTLFDIDIYASTLTNDPPVQQSNTEALLQRKMRQHVESLIDIKLRMAVQFNSNDSRNENKSWFKYVLESKAIQEIGVVVDAKQYRQWNNK